MALTYTVAGLKAELDALETARKGRDWATAWDEYLDYVSVWAALPDAARADARARLPDPDKLAKALEACQAAATRAGATYERFLQAGTDYVSE